jgi:hypothetical protein
MTSSRPHSCGIVFRRRAAALVIILAFVVLLAVLVLAFFSRAALNRQISNASANQTKAEILARSAIDVILGDLRQEMAQGSTVTITNGPTIYYPLSPADMLPARSGNPAFVGATNDPIPNLIRRSVRNDPLATRFGSVSASAANSSENPSANGRTISRSRWNAHYLIPRLNPGSPAIDPTPVAEFVAPDWVMVGTNGPINISAPDSTVIGRFAFAIYDEGGLLDVNVAGYPAGLETYPSAATNVISLKGSAGFADLEMVGVTNADNLVGWRNYATVQPAGTLGAYAFDASALSNYAAFLTSPTNSGFVNVATNSVAGRTDQRFSSRQALLRFQRATGLSQDALQFLGTHSRTLEQPSFRPDPERPKNTAVPVRTGAGGNGRFFGGNDSYDPTGALPDQINPYLLAVRDAEGNPVLRQRFPLSRLALVEQAHLALLGGGTVPSELADDIRQYFGLVWDSANARWNYQSPSGTATVSRIATLAEVATLDREPDFFEVLKAAIECGSLGKQHGGNDGEGSPSRYTRFDASTRPYEGRDGFIDLQIFAIGANLIDQWDTDSYPTRIQSAAGPASAPPARLTCGIENIPTLAGAMTAWYRLFRLEPGDIDPGLQPPAPEAGGNGMPYESAVLIQPIIWNPNAPDSRVSPPNVPTEFQVQMGGINSFQSDTDGTALSMDRPRVRSSWWEDLNTVTDVSRGTPEVTSYPVPTGVFFQYPQAVVNPASNWVRFSYVPGAFAEPYRLQSENYPPGSNASADPAGTMTIGDPQELNEVGASANAIGFYAGRAWTGPVASRHPDAAANASVFFRSLSSGRVGANAAMRLQYRNPYGIGPAYLTYKVIDFMSMNSQWYSIVDADPVFAGGDVTQTPINRGFQTFLLTDPRTSRWGVTTLSGAPAHWQGALPTGVTLPPATTLIPSVYPFPQGKTLSPDGVSATGISYRMQGDLQGSVPKASGWRFFGGNTGRQNVGDVAVNRRDGNVSSPVPGGKFYYTDPDGILRRADGALFDASNGDGLSLRTANFPSRPVVLNRPFRSVAEMGYAFRDTPWKSLDFSHPESGDAALLDAFCLAEIDTDDDIPRVAGRVNLNTRQPAVLAALISGVSKAEGGLLSDAEALAAATRLVEWTGDTNSVYQGVFSRGPLRNRSELVGKFLTTTGAGITGIPDFSADLPNIDGTLAYSGYSAALTNSVFATQSDVAIKRRHESVIRALADSGQVRTWNLLIDVVAQTGRFSQSAGADLSRFIVEGERRYWVHVAIDRFTGEVISKDVELVTDQ